MENRISNVYDNREYISSVTKTHIYFVFPNGSKKGKKISENDIQTLKMVRQWLASEINFYYRMYNELLSSWEKKRENLEKTQHFFSQEEISEACQKDRFADVDMQIANKSYTEEANKLSGVLAEANVILGKLGRMYKLNEQIQSMLKTIS